MAFHEGEVYYRVTYPDRDMLYPSIESFIFVGINLADEDTDDILYFQPSRSFAKFGSVLKSDSGDRAVVSVSSADKNDMMDLAGLFSELNSAHERRGASDL